MKKEMANYKEMKKEGILSIKREENDFSLEPDFYEVDGEKARFAGAMIWIDILDEEHPELPPYLYYRIITDSFVGPEGGLIRYGSDCKTFQEPQPEMEKMIAPGAPLTYAAIEGDPEGKTDDKYTYELRLADGSEGFLCRLSSKYFHVKEGDFLDLTGEWFPETMISYPDTAFPVDYMCLYALFKGTFRGKEVVAIGGMDRLYSPKSSNPVELLNHKLFMGLGFASVNQDDTKEWGLLFWTDGKGTCYYAKDGQETKVSTNVNMNDIVWERVPYLDDDTLVFSKATFEVPDQGLAFHYEAKYGRRGQGAEIVNTPGQIQSGGVWYEESNQVERKYSYTFAESIGVFGKSNPDEHGIEH